MFQRLSPVVKNLLIINLIVFIAPYILSAVMGIQLDFVRIFGLRYFFSNEFEPYQLFTHFFVHASTLHIFSNMFALFMFAPMLETVWGSKRFLTFYLVCGFGASLLYSGVHFWEINQLFGYLNEPNFQSFVEFIDRLGLRSDFIKFIEAYGNNPTDPELIEQSRIVIAKICEAKANVPMVGASGAVFGILMAFGMIFPNVELMLLFPPIPIKAKYMVWLYAAMELYAIIENSPKDNVAHFAHLGGMLFAFILIRYWRSQGARF